LSIVIDRSPVNAVPRDISGLQSLIQDAARLAFSYEMLKEAWSIRDQIRPADAALDRQWHGWLGFCFLSSYAVARADPTRPADEAELAQLRAVFAEDVVKEVVLQYYGGHDAQRSAPVAHHDPDDERVLAALAGSHDTRDLLTVPAGGDAGDETPWTWELHRVGTSALVLAATPTRPHAQKLAVKVIVPAYLQWAEIRAATKERGRHTAMSDALPRLYAATEAIIVSSFVEGATFAELIAERDAALHGQRGTGAQGVSFARASWLRVVQALDVLDRDLPGLGHGDLNPSNVIFRGLTLDAATHVPGLQDAGPAVFVDLGPSHLLGGNPAPGSQALSHLSSYASPELVNPGGTAVDRQKADLYGLGDLLLDCLVPEADADGVGERIDAVYRYSFELGQLVDTLRSHDPDLRTAVHRAPGEPFAWSSFAASAARILAAAEALGGTGLTAFRSRRVLIRSLASDPDVTGHGTGARERAATLGSRERWTVNWLRASRYAAGVIGSVLVGLIAFWTVGCDVPFLGVWLCDLDAAVDTLFPPGETDTVYRVTVVAVALSWLLAAHHYYVRIFALLRPGLCRPLPWARTCEVACRVMAAPAYLLFVGIVRPELWWLWSGAAGILAAVNNWVFARFLRSMAQHLRRTATGSPSADSLSATAHRIEMRLGSEFGSWWIQMGLYGLSCLIGIPALLAVYGRGAEAGLPFIATALNLAMLYRNCSEVGGKAPQIRATGARAIAGHLRLQAAAAAPAPTPAPVPAPAPAPTGSSGS
jgi:hypothetical protein